MAVLTVQEVTAAGITPTYASAAGGGDTFTPSSTDIHIIHIKNGGGSPITMTIDDPTTQTPVGATAFNPDTALVVTNAQERMIEVDPARFANPTTGIVSLTRR
jgi:hypothetical protein